MERNFHNNGIKILNDLYKIGDLWFFDEPYLNIKQELFVPSASAVLDKVLAISEVPGKQNPSIMFGEVLPKWDAEFILEEDMGHSANYSYNGEVFWLCGVTFLYFKEAPKKFYIKFI